MRGILILVGVLMHWWGGHLFGIGGRHNSLVATRDDQIPDFQNPNPSGLRRMKIRIRPAFEDYKSESGSSPRDLNQSPKRSGYLFHSKHMTSEGRQINNVNRRRLRRSDRPVVTIIRLCIVGSGFNRAFLPREQWLYIPETIIASHTDTDRMNFETWRTRSWQF